MEKQERSYNGKIEKLEPGELGGPQSGVGRGEYQRMYVVVTNFLAEMMMFLVTLLFQKKTQPMKVMDN